MKKILYIFLAAVIAFSSCVRTEIDGPGVPGSESDAKVTISFPISIPTDGPSTRAMGNEPDVKNIFVAVFGGSGYFNEWVPAELTPSENPPTQFATENETIYDLKVKLTTSASRLSLHIIANSPVSEPPISGISSNDLESVVMSKIHSRIGSEPSDAYWAKIILPFGVKEKTYITNGVEQPYIDPATGERVPSEETIAQFDHWNPIPLVRNFARIKVKIAESLTNVQIDRIGLVYAPAEGSVAPILPNTYTSDQWGAPITISETDETTEFWNEAFYIDYHSKNMETVGNAPYNYKGYSPADLQLGTYPASLSEMTAWTPETADETYLYLYERAKPRPGQKSTRILIHAKNGSEDWKYYPLDLKDSEGAPEAFLRNYTYTVTLTHLAAGTGETTIADAADATGADVSSDVRANDLTEVSDGIRLIAVSYIDTTAIKAGTYSVMYRFVPDVNNGAVSNNPSTASHPEGVSLKFGYNNGVDGFIEGANSAYGNAFASDPQIELGTNGDARLYVRSGNGWAVATAAQIADSSIEKWSKINYTTVGTAGDYFEHGYTKTIRIIGTKASDGGQVYRDVQINLIPRKTMIVECLDKYIEETAGASETVRVYIPNDITRSMFPLEFKIQAEANSLTPRDGDNLPVQSGKSIIPGKTTQSAFFFIKTLTRDEYNEAPEVTVGGLTMKYFDCKFKSSKATSATTVYVANEYFNEGSDDFKNFIKRLFTAYSPGELGIARPVEFTFYMDNAHTGTMVWNDTENITANNKVIPKEVVVTMIGIQPQTNDDGTYVDSQLSKIPGQGVYLYHVYDETNPNSISRMATLHLEAGNASSYSIELSTRTLTPNPGLYESLSVSGTIVRSRLTVTGFTNGQGADISRVLARANEPVYFRFTYGGEFVPVKFKIEGASTSDSRVSGPDESGYYTFTPNGTAANQVIEFRTTDADTPVSLTGLNVVSESYDQPATTSYSLSRFKYRFGTPGFYRSITNNNPTAVTRISNAAGNTVYYRFIYDSNDAQHQDVTISATGLTNPTSTTGTLTSNGDGTWTYHSTNTATVNHWITWTTEAVASGISSTVTVSSDVYENAPVASVQRRRWVTADYTINIGNGNYNEREFTNQPQNVVFNEYTVGVSDNNNLYKLMGYRERRWALFIPYYEYYSGSFTVTAPNLEGARVSGISMTYQTQGSTTYNSQTVTVEGNVSGSSTLSGSKTTWNSSSTGDGNGETTVTVTMQCADADDYENRNRLTSLTVYYGYWDLE